MRAVEPFAYGVLGLHPWEFPRYTLREFAAKCEGWERGDRRERYRLAEHACWTLSPHLGKGSRLSPADLLGLRVAEDL